MSVTFLSYQIYTFVQPDGTNIHIDSDGLRRWCHTAKPEVFNVPIDAALAEEFLRDNIVSPDRVRQLAKRASDLTPLIFAKDGTEGANGGPNVMLVDGHHRYVLYAFAGHQFAPGFVLEPSEWEPFRVECDWLNTTDAELKALPIPPRHY